MTDPADTATAAVAELKAQRDAALGDLAESETERASDQRNHDAAMVALETKAATEQTVAAQVIADLRAKVAALTPRPTLFGFWAGNVAGGGRGARSNYDAVSAYLGTPDVYRYFYSGSPGTRFVGSNADFGPPVVVSFKFKPADVLAGKADATMTAWFASIPPDRQVWWSYFHEPENDIEAGAYTAEQYRAAWDHLIALAPRRDNLHPTLILMRYSLDVPAKRTISDYVADSLRNHPQGVLAWDSYKTSDALTIKRLVDDPVAVSTSYGLGFAIAETSAKDPSKMAAFVGELKPAAKAAGAQFVTFFETNKAGQGVNEADWRMGPIPEAVAAWRA